MCGYNYYCGVSIISSSAKASINKRLPKPHADKKHVMPMTAFCIIRVKARTNQSMSCDSIHSFVLRASQAHSAALWCVSRRLTVAGSCSPHAIFPQAPTCTPSSYRPPFYPRPYQQGRAKESAGNAARGVLLSSQQRHRQESRTQRHRQRHSLGFGPETERGRDGGQH